MRLSNSTAELTNHFTFEETIDLLAEAGYDCADFGQKYENIFKADLSRERLVEWRKYAEAKGIFFNQSHAPFPSSFMDERATQRRFDVIVDAIKKASFLGVEHIVVHPCQHLDYSEEENREILFQYNMDFFRKLQPYGEQYGIKIALENIWQDQTGMINHSTCSRPAEFIRYLDELNSECFVACLDLGHATLVREDLPNFIRALGNKRLRCLHVQDVSGSHDTHTLPYYGIINWEKVMAALAEIDYQGDLTFEADGFFNGLPSCLHLDAQKMMAKTGKHLISLFERYKA